MASKQVFIAVVAEAEDDLMLIEEDVETIDLAIDSDEERPLIIEEDRDPYVDEQEDNHEQKRTTKIMHKDLDIHFKESENKIDETRLENTRSTDGNEEFVNSSKDNSSDRFQVKFNLIQNLLEELRNSKMSIFMRRDIQKHLKYLEDQENKLDSLLASIPSGHAQRRSLEKKKRKLCARLRQKLIVRQNAISYQDKESNNSCFSSQSYLKNVCENDPNQKNNEIIEQKQNIAVCDNRNEENCSESNDGTTIGGTTFDNTSQENENSNLTVGNPTELINTSSTIDGIHSKIDTGQTVSLLEQLDPRNLRASIIFEDEEDDDFYLGLGDNGAMDTSAKCDNAVVQTNIVDITDGDSNSGGAKDTCDCTKPCMSHSSPQLSALERAASNKSLLLDKYKIEQVAYVKELIKETSKELICFKNILPIEQNRATEGNNEETINQVHDVQKVGSDMNPNINKAIAVSGMLGHNDSASESKQMEENILIEPKTSYNNLKALKQYTNNKCCIIKANAISLHLQATMQNTNARDSKISYDDKERDMSENKDGASSSNVNQMIESYIKPEHKHKDGIYKTYDCDTNLNQSESNMSGVVQYVDVGRPKDLDEPNHNVTNVNEPVESDNETPVLQIVESTDTCEPIDTKSKNHVSGDNVVVVKSFYESKPKSSDVNRVVPIELKFEKIKDCISTADEHKTTVDSREVNTENNYSKLDSLERESENSNINAELNCVEASSSGATIGVQSEEMSAAGDNHHEEETGEWRITLWLVASSIKIEYWKA